MYSYSQNSSTIRNIAFFFCGLYVCFCDNLAIPKAVSLACLLPCLYYIYSSYFFEEHKSLCVEGTLFIKWYGLFILFICVSSLWSPNSMYSSNNSTETTVFVFKRILNVFVITLIYNQLKPTVNDFYVTLKGVFIGTLIGCIIGLLVEKNAIGITRIGGMSYGAGTAFGNVADFGIGLSLLFMYKESKIWSYAPLLMFFFFVIIISGSRQPLVCAVIYVSVIKLFRERKNILSYISFFIFSLVVVTVVFYLVMNVDFFYDMLGYRFESILNHDDASDTERMIMRSYAMELFFENPIAGVGVHGFATLFGQWYGWRVWSHCGYTEILSCYGIIGFILYYRFYLQGLFNKIFGLNNRLLSAFFLAILLNITFTDLFHPVFLDVRSMFFFGLILQPYTNSEVNRYKMLR